VCPRHGPFLQHFFHEHMHVFQLHIAEIGRCRHIRRIPAVGERNPAAGHDGLCGVECVPKVVEVHFKPGMQIHRIEVV